jgi:hypothetical protein
MMTVLMESRCRRKTVQANGYAHRRGLIDLILSRGTMSQLLTMTNPNGLKGLAASKIKVLRRSSDPFGL